MGWCELVLGAVTSSVVTLTVTPPHPIAYWRMESQITAPNNAGVPTWPGIADTDTNPGQGVYTTGTLSPAVDDLITFNGMPGQPVTLSSDVAPAGMFVNGHNAGFAAYNAEALTNVDGCLFFPQDQYGDELDFTGPFTLELFFKTDGNRSGSGPMELFCQGSDGHGFAGAQLRYGLAVNAAGPGALTFTVANRALTQTNVVNLTGTNFADGQWHYLQAVCDTLGGPNGQLRLMISNEDGSQVAATNNLPAGFLPLPAADDGNAFVGRYTYPVADDPRTFLGWIDEVQITAGVEPDVWRLGRVPAIDNHPLLTGLAAGTNGFSFQWTGAAANDVEVEWAARLGDAWQIIATLPATNGVSSFFDSNANRSNGAAGYYRIVLQ